jgi:hypothetical protein
MEIFFYINRKVGIVTEVPKVRWGFFGIGVPRIRSGQKGHFFKFLNVGHLIES